MLLTVDVLGLKVDVFVVDVLKVDVLEVVQMGRPAYIHLNMIITNTISFQSFCGSQRFLDDDNIKLPSIDKQNVFEIRRSN
jgi:hypothetical protein